MNHLRRNSLIILFVLLALATAHAEESKPSSVQRATLGETRNVHSCGKLFLAGQPTQDDFDLIKQRGIKRVITLRRDGEVDWDEAAKAKATGLEFVSIPFAQPDSLTDKVFDQVRSLLKEADKKPTLLHCGSANRVGAVWLTHRVLDEGVPLETAIKEAKQIGLRSPAYEEKARAYIKTKSE